MTTSEITLVPLPESRRDTFIQELQTSFAVAVVEEYGPQEGEIIPRADIEQSLDQPGAEALQILLDGAAVGGAVVSGAQTGRRSLDLLYLRQNCHSRGIGLAAWQAIEARYPDTAVWETITTYFEKRNNHFYVNKCGFKIVEFFNPHHRDPREPDNGIVGRDYYFRFEKDLYQS